MILHRPASRINGAIAPVLVLLLAISLLATGAPRTALADCAPNPAANGDIVLCTGADTDGIASTFDAITVNVLDGASVNNAAGDAIFLDTSPDSFVNAFGNGTIGTTGNGDNGALIIGDNATITLNDSASVSTAGTAASGLFIDGSDAAITLNDDSTISTTGVSGDGATIDLGTGSNATITLNDRASINTAGDDAEGAAIRNGDNGSIILNDFASISTTGGSGAGAEVDGDNGTITLNDNASISTAGNNAIGAFLFNGSNGTVTLAEGTAINTAGNFAYAVRFITGSNTLINHGTLNSTGARAVFGDDNAANFDTIFNDGTISSDTGFAIALADGNDFLTLGTGSTIIGVIDGGTGSDTVTLNGVGNEDDLFNGFEFLTMSGEDWSLTADSTFSLIAVVKGRLGINGNITAFAAGPGALGILGGSGVLISDTISIGTIAPGNSVGTLTIVGVFSQTGGAFDIEFDKNGIDRLNVTGAVMLANNPAVHVSPLHGAAGANGVFLHSDTSITGAIGAADYAGNGAATLVQGANDITVIAVDGTPLVASNFAALQAGLDYLGTVNGAQLDQIASCLDVSCAIPGARHIWARAFGRFGNEDAQNGNQGFDTRTAGTAIGGDIEVAEGLSLGASAGYANTSSEVDFNAAEADIDGEFAALYANYELGRFFVTGIASGGLQQFDLSRKVAVTGGTETARAETDGWLAGGSLQAGIKLDFAGGWRLTPSAGIAYQHQSVDGYNEHGAGAGNVKVDDQTSDAIRFNAQLNVARTLSYDSFAVVPHIRLGVAGQINIGDDVDGAFSTGDDFTLAQQSDDRAMGLAGAGLDIAFTNGHGVGEAKPSDSPAALRPKRPCLTAQDSPAIISSAQAASNRLRQASPP